MKQNVFSVLRSRFLAGEIFSVTGMMFISHPHKITTIFSLNEKHSLFFSYSQRERENVSSYEQNKILWFFEIFCSITEITFPPYELILKYDIIRSHMLKLFILTTAEFITTISTISLFITNPMIGYTTL